MKVAKFGGSSLADAAQFQKVKRIILEDPQRRFVVPSAPGKRHKDDTKITDMLYQCHSLAEKGESIEPVYAHIRARYLEIIRQLELSLPFEEELAGVQRDIETLKSPDFAASRGEYLCGKILAAYLGWTFVDAAEVIKFDKQGAFSAEWTNEVMAERLSSLEQAVIPGFYGSLPNGEVKTFSRGGSDISGAIVARAVKADVYENWTDVCGFMMADPRIVDNPKEIASLTYRELRELSYMGATVLHEDAIFPVRRAKIPTNIRNTNQPEHPGTMIYDSMNQCGRQSIITGIAGRKNFTILSIEKAMMNAELGFGRRVLGALESFGVSFEHLPTGIDTMCVIIEDKALSLHRDEILERIRDICQPDSMEMSSGLALIATVGRGMVRTRGTAAQLFTALAQANVNVRMIDQGSSELNIIVGVNNEDFERAVRAIYHTFIEG